MTQFNPLETLSQIKGNSHLFVRDGALVVEDYDPHSVITEVQVRNWAEAAQFINARFDLANITKLDRPTANFCDTPPPGSNIAEYTKYVSGQYCKFTEPKIYTLFRNILWHVQAAHELGVDISSTNDLQITLTKHVLDIPNVDSDFTNAFLVGFLASQNEDIPRGHLISRYLEFFDLFHAIKRLFEEQAPAEYSDPLVIKIASNYCSLGGTCKSLIRYSKLDLPRDLASTKDLSTLPDRAKLVAEAFMRAATHSLKRPLEGGTQNKEGGTQKQKGHI